MTNGDLEAEENPPNHRSSNDQNMSILYITIATLLAIIVLVGLSVAIIHKLWTRKLPRHNTAQQNDSNESLMQRQVTEVGGYSRVPMRDPPPYSSQEVHMADEETQGHGSLHLIINLNSLRSILLLLPQAQPWTKDFTDQTTGGNQADTDETAPKEKTTSVDQQDSNTETLEEVKQVPRCWERIFPNA
ncbi:uncharacterized protein LOC124273084 isoform X2 [Haliotis rubra]|uniref:uncharacterized protein LOC124273084 isoform X2 n=1 Tax=Haliotis rubra TaxID=36100 RepID=UPI001EE59047|nr:uncharacterized protein LOC124273084 isoform X2 [Haliotis rubra]